MTHEIRPCGPVLVIEPPGSLAAVGCKLSEMLPKLVRALG